MELWPFIPQRGITESLEWLTDVIRCKAGEDRVALRHLPRQSYQVLCHLDPEQYGRAKVFSRTQAQDFLFPMWQHYENIGNIAPAQDTIAGAFDERFFGVGQRVVVWSNDRAFHTTEVEVFDAAELTLATAPAATLYDACIMPLQVVRWSQSPDYTLSTQAVIAAQLVIKAVGAVELQPSYSYPQYRGKDVLLDDNALISELTENHFRELDEVDNGTGIIAGTPVYSDARTASRISWSPLDRAERMRMLEWIHSRRGRRRAFWYRSHNKDFAPTSGVGPNQDDPGYDVLMVDTPVAGIGDNVPFDIVVERNTGELRFYRVQAASIVANSQTALRLSPRSGTTWILPEIRRISIMTCVRFDSDRVEVNYTSGGGATISMPIIEVPGS